MAMVGLRPFDFPWHPRVIPLEFCEAHLSPFVRGHCPTTSEPCHSSFLHSRKRMSASRLFAGSSREQIEHALCANISWGSRRGEEGEVRNKPVRWDLPTAELAAPMRLLTIYRAGPRAHSPPAPRQKALKWEQAAHLTEFKPLTLGHTFAQLGFDTSLWPHMEYTASTLTSFLPSFSHAVNPSVPPLPHLWNGENNSSYWFVVKNK